MLGHVHPGTAMPLVARDMHGREVAEEYFRIERGEDVVTTQDMTPMMMTNTVRQTRRDCLFYICRRRR